MSFIIIISSYIKVFLIQHCCIGMNLILVSITSVLASKPLAAGKERYHQVSAHRLSLSFSDLYEADDR